MGVSGHKPNSFQDYCVTAHVLLCWLRAVGPGETATDLEWRQIDPVAGLLLSSITMLWLMRGGAPCFFNAFIQNSQYSYYLKNRSMLLVGLQSRGSAPASGLRVFSY